VIFLQKAPKIFKIEDKNGNLVPFILNHAQQKLLELVEYQLKNDSANGKRKAGTVRINIPKARQLGLSTFIKMLEVSCAIENIGWNTFTVAHDLNSSVGIFKKVKTAYNNLPQTVKSRLIETGNNQSNLEFTAAGKKQSSSMSTSSSGRSGTYQFLHISELGQMSLNKQKWAETVSGTKPAVEKAKFVFYESTCDGGLGKYYEFTMATENGETEFDNLFLPWYVGDDYTLQAPDDDSWMEDYERLSKQFDLYANPMERFGITKDQFFWYYTRCLSFKSEGDGGGIKVQYPFSIDEAFVARSGAKFDLSAVKSVSIMQPMHKVDNVKYYRTPEPGQKYSVSADIASGFGADFSAITVRGLYPDDDGVNRVYAQMKAKVTPEVLGYNLIAVGEYFNQFGNRCYFAPERNFDSSLVIKMLRDHFGDDYIYKERIKDPSNERDALHARFGFLTQKGNRSGYDALMIDEFEMAFRNKQIDIVNDDEVAEMLHFMWNEEKNRFDHAPGYHDDLLISDMICLQNFKYIHKYG